MQRARSIPEAGFNRRRHRSFVQSKDGGPMLDLDTPEGLKARHKIAERDIEDLKRKWQETNVFPVPLPFHWNGQVDRFLNVRNAPGEFGRDGLLQMIRYRWDVAPATETTVEWELDGVPAFTHTLPASTDPYVVYPATSYGQEVLSATVTTVGADGLGLTAFVYLDR